MRRHVWLVAVLLCLFVLTGCWDRKELSQYALVSGVFIDKKSSEYQVSLQVINTKEVTNKGGSSAPVTVFTQKGKTISEAMQRIAKISPRQLFLGHFRILVISERLARDGVRKELDVFRRKVNVRSDFSIIVLKDSFGQNPFTDLVPLEKLSASFLYDTQKNSEKQFASSKTVRVHDIVSVLAEKGKDAVLPAVEIKGKHSATGKIDQYKSTVPPTLFEFSGLAVFHDDKLQGWLNENETILFNIMTGKVKLSNLVVPCTADNGFISYSIDKSKSSLKSKMDNNNLQLGISVKVDAYIEETSCMSKLSNPNQMKQLEKQLAADLKQKMTNLINHIRMDFKSDLFGFGAKIHRSNPKQWQQISGRWDQLYATADLDIEVKVLIKDTGSITDPDIVDVGD